MVKIFSRGIGQTAMPYKSPQEPHIMKTTSFPTKGYGLCPLWLASAVHTTCPTGHSDSKRSGYKTPAPFYKSKRASSRRPSANLKLTL